MLSVEAVEKLGDTMELVRGQIEAGEPGSNEQLRSAQIYDILHNVECKVQEQAFKIDDNSHNDALEEIKRADEAKEKKWQHGIKIAEIVLPVAGGVAALCLGLNFEKTNTIVSGLVKTVSSKVIKFVR